MLFSLGHSETAQPGKAAIAMKEIVWKIALYVVGRWRRKRERDPYLPAVSDTLSEWNSAEDEEAFGKLE